MHPPMLTCGCQAHATRTLDDGTRVPSCVVHDCIEKAEVPDFEGRMARCACGKERPSFEATNGSLAFFEFRGRGSREAREMCGLCHYHKNAHSIEHMTKLARGPFRHKRRRTVVEDGRCTGFLAKGPSDTDRFYCGCRGWD